MNVAAPPCMVLLAAAAYLRGLPASPCSGGAGELGDNISAPGVSTQVPRGIQNRNLLYRESNGCRDRERLLEATWRVLVEVLAVPTLPAQGSAVLAEEPSKHPKTRQLSRQITPADPFIPHLNTVPLA